MFLLWRVPKSIFYFSRDGGGGVGGGNSNTKHVNIVWSLIIGVARWKWHVSENMTVQIVSSSLGKNEEIYLNLLRMFMYIKASNGWTVNIYKTDTRSYSQSYTLAHTIHVFERNTFYSSFALYFRFTHNLSLSGNECECDGKFSHHTQNST